MADTHEPDASAASPWRVGESVPWSVAWTGEQSFRLAPSRDFPGFTDLIQTEAPGQGTPIFAVNHITRNRRGLFQHLCHVCGTPTRPRDRYLFPVVTGGFVPLGDGQVGYGGNVPPVHRACAERAQRLCPHLRRLYAEPVPFPRDEGRMVWRTDVQPGLESLARRLPAGLKVVFACYRLFGPDFTRQVQRLRAG